MTPHRKKCPHVVHFNVPRDWFEQISSPVSTLSTRMPSTMTAITTWEEMKVSTGKLGLKMTNRIHTNERKMVQLYYLVPGCVISMFEFLFINGSTLVRSGE